MLSFLGEGKKFWLPTKKAIRRLLLVHSYFCSTSSPFRPKNRPSYIGSVIKFRGRGVSESRPKISGVHGFHRVFRSKYIETTRVPPSGLKLLLGDLQNTYQLNGKFSIPKIVNLYTQSCSIGPHVAPRGECPYPCSEGRE